MKRFFVGAAGVIVVLVIAGACAAKELTVKEVIELKSMRYTDEEVLAEIAKTQSTFALTAADVKALKDAGAGDRLIQAMRGQGKPVGPAEAVKMLKEGKSEKDVVEAIAGSPQRPAIELAQVRELTENKVPLSVILALRGKALGAGQLRLLAEKKAPADVYGPLGALLGYEKQPVAPGDALALVEAGVPKEVVAQLREAGAGRTAEKKPVEKQPAEEEAAEKKPVDKHPDALVGMWEGILKLTTGNETEITLRLDADGMYELRFRPSGVVSGKWRIDGPQFVMDPDVGQVEKHPWELDRSKTVLKIKGATGTMELTKRQ